MFGEKTARAVWESGREAINAIEKIISTLKIDCAWKRVPEFIFANDASQLETIKKEVEEAQKLHFPVDLKNKEDSALPFSNEGSMVIPDQAKFHPLKYGEGLR